MANLWLSAILALGRLHGLVLVSCSLCTREFTIAGLVVQLMLHQFAMSSTPFDIGQYGECLFWEVQWFPLRVGAVHAAWERVVHGCAWLCRLCIFQMFFYPRKGGLHLRLYKVILPSALALCY